MPYASEVPHVEADYLETPSPLNPLGIKGAGEAGCIPVGAVIVPAIEDAEGLSHHRDAHLPRRAVELRKRHAAGDLPALEAPPTPSPCRRTGRAAVPPQGARPMKISGTASLAAPPEKVWDAFHDPGSLARCLPGCESLTEIGLHQYAMTVTAGVAAIKGTYDGRVALTEQQHPGSFTLKAKGAGAPGTVDADVKVRLAPSANGGTDLTYDADAAVGGVIGGVGQRMLAGVTKKMAGQFFTAVDNDIAGVPVGPVPAPGVCLPASRPPLRASPPLPCMPVRPLPPHVVRAGQGLCCRGRSRRPHRPGRCGRRRGDREALMRAFTAAAVQIAPVAGPLSPEAVRKNLDKCVDFTCRCVEDTGAELVVLPETATTGFTPDCTTRSSGTWSQSCPDR